MQLQSPNPSLLHRRRSAAAANGKRSEKTAEESYSWDVIAKLQAELYESLRPITE